MKNVWTKRKRWKLRKDEINVINKEYSWQFKSNLAIIYSLTAPTYSPRLSSESAEQEDALGGLANWAIVMGIVRHLAARFKINAVAIKNRGDQRQQQPRMNHNEYNMNTQWARQAHSDNNKATSPQAES